jgi:hypothetical protein
LEQPLYRSRTTRETVLETVAIQPLEQRRFDNEI